MTETEDEHRPRHFAAKPARRRPVAELWARVRNLDGDAPTPVPPVDEPASVPSDGGGSEAPPRRGWHRWRVPAALAAVAVFAGLGAVGLDRKPVGTPVGVSGPLTSVLSARRVPELVAAPLAEKRLRHDLDAWLGQSPPDTCLAVEWAGSPVFEHRVEAQVTGASTHKLLTAAGLLLELGPDARLSTRTVAAAAPVDGVLAGDLHLIGGGDPFLAVSAWRDAFARRPRTINDIDDLVQQVADAGVTRIEGSVVGNATRYDDETYHPIWPSRFHAQGQVGRIAGLIVNDGFVLSSQSAVPAADPALDAARVLTERLQAGGIEVQGAPQVGPPPAGATELASLESPPVSEIAAQMIRDSDAETSEMAFKELGLAVVGEGSWPAGVEALRQTLSEAGVPLDDVEIVDGSGFAIENLLTCSTLTEVLTLPETAEHIQAGLAVAGETGTLAGRWRGSPVEGRLRAKTGSLRNVTALAGQVETLQGEELTFAYVANVADPGPHSSADGLLTPEDVDEARLGEILVEYPRDIDLAELGPLGGPAVRPDPDGSTNGSA